MLLSALLLLQAAAAAPCPATPAPLPAELAGWAAQAPVTAPATLTLGRGARATLLPVASVHLAVPTTRPQAPGGSAGVFAFTVTAAGRYRVALGAGVWVDVVGGGHALTSVAHGHGPACSPVKKMVDFDLQPGSYQLQVVGSDTPVLSLMVAKL